MNIQNSSSLKSQRSDMNPNQNNQVECPCKASHNFVSLRQKLPFKSTKLLISWIAVRFDKVYEVKVIMRIGEFN